MWEKIDATAIWRGRGPFSNVIEGTSVSCQEEANEFVPILLQTNAAVKALSCEPLLGPISLSRTCSPVSTG
jgi:protein gp37